MKHLHQKIGIKQNRNRLWYVCSVCGKCLSITEVLNSLHRELGDNDIEYWRRLRDKMERMRFDKKRGVSFEGIFLP